MIDNKHKLTRRFRKRGAAILLLVAIAAISFACLLIDDAPTHTTDNRRALLSEGEDDTLPKGWSMTIMTAAVPYTLLIWNWLLMTKQVMMTIGIHILGLIGIRSIMKKEQWKEKDSLPSLSLVASMIFAGIVMHSPGLMVKIGYETIGEYMISTFGAACEGVFLLLLMMWIYNSFREVTYHPLWEQQPRTVRLCFYLLGICFGLGLCLFIIISISGDATFRLMSGNDSLTSDLIMDGLQNFRSHSSSEFTIDPVGASLRLLFACISFAGSIGVYVYSLRRRMTQLHHDESKINLPKVPFGVVYTLGLLAGYLATSGCYSPFLFGAHSILSSLKIGSSDSLVTSHYDDLMTSKRASSGAGSALAPSSSKPNIIYIQHESLSGAVMLNTENGRSAMPYFQYLAKTSDDLYVFRNTRSVSGNTIDALPAMLTGCLPMSDVGKETIESIPAIAQSLYDIGYATASFSSRAIDSSIKTGQWKNLLGPLTKGMEQVYDATSDVLTTKGEGCDDRDMLRIFEEWFNSTSVISDQPFYAQMYNFNSHYPYWKDKDHPKDEHRYISSLRTNDETIKGLFEILERNKKLDNTIIIGSGDHGDDPFKNRYVRLSALNSNVLHSAAYIYYPAKLMKDETVARRLRSNTQKLTSTLDFHPTIMGIIHGDSDNGYVSNTNDGCAHGVDLASTEIDDNRLAVSMNSVSNFNGDHLWAVSKGERALYHRKSNRPFPALHQGRDNSYLLEFGNCTSNSYASCAKELDSEGKDYFRAALQNITSSSSTLSDEDVQKSDLITFLLSKVL